MGPETHECPYCGDIFEAEHLAGRRDIPPCLPCAFAGYVPMTEEEFELKKLMD